MIAIIPPKHYYRTDGQITDVMFEYQPNHFISVRAAHRLNIRIPPGLPTPADTTLPNTPSNPSKPSRAKFTSYLWS